MPLYAKYQWLWPAETMKLHVSGTDIKYITTVLHFLPSHYTDRKGYTSSMSQLEDRAGLSAVDSQQMASCTLHQA